MRVRSRFGVVLERRGRTLSLVIEDDGVGFDAATVSNTMIGLVGMRERAAVVGGSFDIEPTAGGGTTVTGSGAPVFDESHFVGRWHDIGGVFASPAAKLVSICPRLMSLDGLHSSNVPSRLATNSSRPWRTNCGIRLRR